ncbi:MAG: NRDE family protein, partial [Paraglaciecola sp.]
MCILFVAINQHKDYPLIIAANRDEYFARET